MAELLVGVVAGVVASVTFFFILACFRPRLHISPQVARTPTELKDVPHLYRVKIVNKSRRSAMDLHVEAYLTTYSRAAGVAPGERGTVIQRLRVPISQIPSVITGYRRRDKDAHHAIWLRIDPDAGAAVANGDNSLTLSIQARDGWSGFPRALTMLYELPSDVIDGIFVPGSKMAILPADARAKHEASAIRTPLPDSNSGLPATERTTEAERH